MIVALNNKSNLEKEEFMLYQRELSGIVTPHKLIVCPTLLNIARYALPTMSLGSQNVSKTTSGAYTGEVSAEQLKSYGVEYTIVGHSERREYQRESLNDICEKIKRLLENEISPILCIGETEDERNKNQVEKVLELELDSALSGLTEEEISKIIIAYEPIWSIGTGVIPTKEQIEEVFHYIKDKLPNNKVLYGGSANEENVDMLKTISLIDGYLLGGLSLKPDKLEVFLKKL